MPKIKMIVSDVDGTLVDSSEKIPQELVDVVRRCQDAGIIFALATGRTNELAAPFVEALGITGPCVEANGAYILQQGKCVVEHGFTLNPIKDIVQLAHNMGLTVTLSDTKFERATRLTDYVKEHQEFGGRFKELLPIEQIDWENDHFHKVMFMDENHTGNIIKIRTMLEPYANTYWITRYSDTAVEIGPKDCNKASGVRELAKLMNIDIADVMACGDFWNDYEMVSQVGWGVAVGNAMEELKKVAKYVAKARYALGVVEAINALCFDEA